MQVIVDVREQEEYSMERVDGALNVPLSLLQQGDISTLSDVSLNTAVTTYCRSGARAQVACKILKSHGFTDVRNGINKSEIEGQWCDA